MKLQKDNLHDKIILTFTEEEYLAALAAIRGATGDDSRKGEAYSSFYSQDKGFMVTLYNNIMKAEKEA